jgi:hypothetical protein
VKIASALVAIGVPFSVCGACTNSQDMLRETANARHTQAIADCTAGLHSKRFTKRIEYAQCLKTANLYWWREAKAPHIELVEYAAARDIVLAERFDKGRMSEAEYDAERAKIKADLFSEMERRGTNAALVDAARAASAPISCTTLGATTTCR